MNQLTIDGLVSGALIPPELFIGNGAVQSGDYRDINLTIRNAADVHGGGAFGGTVASLGRYPISRTYVR